MSFVFAQKIIYSVSSSDTKRQKAYYLIYVKVYIAVMISGVLAVLLLAHLSRRLTR